MEPSVESNENALTTCPTLQQRELAKETKRVRTAELKASNLKIEKIMPPTNSTSGTDATASTSTTIDKSEHKTIANSSHLLHKNATKSDTELNKSVQQESVPITSQTFDVVEKPNEALTQVDSELQRTTSNEQDTKKQQEWLTKVHEAILPHKLSTIANVDEAPEATSSDDYHVTENVALKIDRQPEWLAAVRASMENYKAVTP